jgi:hypothetical protein
VLDLVEWTEGRGLTVTKPASSVSCLPGVRVSRELREIGNYNTQPARGT